MFKKPGSGMLLLHPPCLNELELFAFGVYTFTQFIDWNLVTCLPLLCNCASEVRFLNIFGIPKMSCKPFVWLLLEAFSEILASKMFLETLLCLADWVVSY